MVLPKLFIGSFVPTHLPRVGCGRVRRDWRAILFSEDRFHGRVRPCLPVRGSFLQMRIVDLASNLCNRDSPVWACEAMELLHRLRDGSFGRQTTMAPVEARAPAVSFRRPGVAGSRDPCDLLPVLEDTLRHDLSDNP